eukprot:4613097-Heterocapsa_arctica.AAC.1
MKLLGIDEAYVYIGRGLAVIPNKESVFGDYSHAYTMLWDTERKGKMAVALRSIELTGATMAEYGLSKAIDDA